MTIHFLVSNGYFQCHSVLLVTVTSIPYKPFFAGPKRVVLYSCNSQLSKRGQQEGDHEHLVTIHCLRTTIGLLFLVCVGFFRNDQRQNRTADTDIKV